MNCRKFKPDIFWSLLICCGVLAVAVASLVTERWVEARGNVWNETRLDTVNISGTNFDCKYGLYYGQKTTTYGRTSKTKLQIVCDSSIGVCMYSCGTTSSLAHKDLANLLQTNITGILSTIQAQINYCPEFPHQTHQEDMARSCLLEEKFDERKSLMVSFSMVVCVFVFLIFGILLTLLTTILTAINTCQNPVSAIWGVDGLVIFNSTAGFIYFIVMVLWGAEFSNMDKKNISISDTLRPCGIQWRTKHLSLGVSYWILIISVFLHILNATLLGVRQYRRYYSTQAQRARSLKLKVADDTTATGTVMMF